MRLSVVHFDYLPDHRKSCQQLSRNQSGKGIDVKADSANPRLVEVPDVKHGVPFTSKRKHDYFSNRFHPGRDKIRDI